MLAGRKRRTRNRSNSDGSDFEEVKDDDYQPSPVT